MAGRYRMLRAARRDPGQPAARLFLPFAFRSWPAILRARRGRERGVGELLADVAQGVYECVHDNTGEANHG